MHSALRLVSDRLPHLRELAARLFERDEVFREMCDEYELCHTTQARTTPAAGTAGAVRREYVALGLRLEGELLRYLAANADE
jgi:glutamyl/glutaminyl-tRNA synthetase